MAISPPSDLLLDVASAADPVKVRAATERLASLAADPAAANDGFSQALAAASKPGAAAIVTQTSTAAPYAAPAGARGLVQLHATDAYQRFEALMLQNFVETMLPNDDELYGDKESAGAYRSMMAEQLANQIAKAGGIGIAKAVETAHPAIKGIEPGARQST